MKRIAAVIAIAAVPLTGCGATKTVEDGFGKTVAEKTVTNSHDGVRIEPFNEDCVIQRPGVAKCIEKVRFSHGGYTDVTTKVWTVDYGDHAQIIGYR